MRFLTLFAALFLFLPSFSLADDCEYSEPRTATVDAAGAREIVVESGAGWLVVEGRPGLDTVEVDAMACADNARDLDRIELVAERRGDRIVVKAESADSRFGWSDGWMNMTVLVPEGLAADINDGSGEVKVSGVGDLELNDGSGDLEIRAITGDVDVNDGSGEIDLEDVDGQVEINDGSGDIRIRYAASAEINDGSGDIEARDLTGDLIVDSDGSGDIEATGIGGDFVVEDDGSGSIRYDGVQGRVELPDDDWD